MNPTSPTPSAVGTKKRARHDDQFTPLNSPSPTLTTSTSVSSIASSSFRNVSACNRCRLRKNRCDQNLPACSSCEKSHTRCVGYDPITKKEIPRSYAYYLETRVSYLESLLEKNDIPFALPEAFDSTLRPESNHAKHTTLAEQQAGDDGGNTIKEDPVSLSNIERGVSSQDSTWAKKRNDTEKLNKLVSNIGMVSVQGASDPRYLGSTSGISFARVVFAAVKSSVSSTSSERNGVRPSKPATTDGTSMRDSFFGLHTKPTINQAPLPDQELALKLVELYFEHANPQIPILHRGEFMALFDRTYSKEDKDRTARELYILNIVFAIGAGIIWGDSNSTNRPKSPRSPSSTAQSPNLPSSKRQRLSNQQHQPEEYHASAIVHLESFLGASPAADRPDGFGGGLEELQAVLLLAGFALLRPVAPGLWYIVGVAVRLGIDLGLHHEDGFGIEGSTRDNAGVRKSEDAAVSSPDTNGGDTGNKGVHSEERGRREWVRDLRRRLWWCVYSFDRLVSTCVGRPFGVSDQTAHIDVAAKYTLQVVTTEFPSLLDDNYINKSGFVVSPARSNESSYKYVAHHYFKLRLLQSEILQVLQHQQAQQARFRGANRDNQFIHRNLPSPFLQNFDSFRAWRNDVDRRLWAWKESAPTKQQTGVQFSIEFLELNYWQAVIMLYRQSLAVPSMFAGERNPVDDVNSSSSTFEEHDDEERVFLKVAEAGQKVLRLYRQLHRVHLVNYTFLATHHLFMAGISFLYAIWHSALVRSRLSMDDVDFTILAATSVLGDLIEKCPPAEACRDAFDRMSKATVQMCMSTTGFGSQISELDSKQVTQYSSTPTSNDRDKRDRTFGAFEPNQTGTHTPGLRYPESVNRPRPQFDMNLGDLFPHDGLDNRSSTRSSKRGNQRNSFSPIRPKPEALAYILPNQDRGQIKRDDDVCGVQARNLNSAIDLGLEEQRLAEVQMYPLPSYFEYGLQTPQLSECTVSSSLDLGFGLGLDIDHDWSDGAQLDLFEGFYFGNSGTGM